MIYVLFISEKRQHMEKNTKKVAREVEKLELIIMKKLTKIMKINLEREVEFYTGYQEIENVQKFCY